MNRYYLILSILIISATIFAERYSFSQEERGAVRVNKEKSELAYNNVYGLVIGVSDYKHVTKLKYAHKDAFLITKVLEQTLPDSNHEIITLTEKSANELSILNGLAEISGKAKEGDLVVFYFAGHGDVAYVEGSKRGYYLTSAASSSREYESGGAIRFDAVHDSIIKITNKGAKVYLITDACRSGTIIDANGTSLTLNALNTGFEKTTKFISCQANELSYEYDELGHGVFTYYLVQQLNKNNSDGLSNEITVRTLNNMLIDAVEQATEFKQSPTVMGYNRNAPIFEYFEHPENLFNIGKANDLMAEERAVNSNTSKGDLISRFENALLDGNLEGNTNAASQILKNAKVRKSVTEDELKRMQNMLAGELMERANLNMNSFLEGNVKTNQTIDFEQSEKDLKRAAELLGSEHFMYTKLTNRAQFFQAMKLLMNRNPNDFDKTEKLLLKLENNEPKATYVHQGLAMLYIAKNDKKNAEKQLATSRQRINSWTKPVNTAANLNLMAGELDQALENLNLSESLSDDLTEVYLLRSELQFANRQLMDAQQTIEKLSKSSYLNNSQEKAIVMGKIEELRGRVNEAQSIYREELKNNKTSPELLMKLGDLALKEGDTTTALGYFSKILNVDPNNISAKNAIAIINGNTIDQEINYYDIQEVVSLLDELYASKGIDKGLEVLEKALQINNWTPEYHYQKGKFLYEKGDKSGAEQELRKAMELSPYNFESIKALAIILIEQKKHQQADDLIRNYEKYFDRSSKWLSFKYKCYYQMNARRDLFPILEKAIAYDSLDLEPRREFVLLHIEENQFKYALIEHKKLMRIGGTDFDEARLLFYIKQEVTNEYQKKNYIPLSYGIEYLITENPVNENYIFMGAMIAYMNKDYKKAEKYTVALQRDLQLYSKGFQLEIMRMRAKIYLETKHYKEAESAFLAYNKSTVQKDYLGLAMAQFELGKKKDWQENWKRHSPPDDYSEDAFNRYQKMKKKAK